MRTPWILGLALAIAGSAAGVAAEPGAEKTAAPKAESKWVFSLLPKSFQKNPRLEMTVITEVTEEGKKRAPVSPAAPAYYELFTAGPKHLGDSQGSERTLTEDQMRPLLTRALRTNGYVVAEPPAHPPSIMVFYSWGVHAMLREGDEENPVLSGNMIARNMLDRAALVGGDKFAREVLRLFREADAMETAAGVPTPTGGQPVFTEEMMAFANPIAQFKAASAKNESLLDQMADDVYYITASAYDYAALAREQRVLLWRTRMTVAAAGVSQEQTLPTLALAAGPYFGKEMPEAETLSRRALRDGTVEVGTPTVVENDVPEPAKR